MLVQLISQMKVKPKAGFASCGFRFGDTYCGETAIANIGGTPVCLEHLEYASGLSPGYSYMLVVNGRSVQSDRSNFLEAARKEAENVRS